MSAPSNWTITGLLDYFQETDDTPDRRFAFILGAGASVQSGIPMAGHLVDNWLRELHAREDHQHRALASWATAETLGIPGFDHARAVEWYSQVFARRFAGRPDEGHAYLERILHGKDPSFGYSVLAQILANTRHRVVITTNFDNLVADALAIYTNQLPFVCGHESLAGFVRPNPRRPLVIKIHRDLLLAPKNTSDEIAALPDNLVASLRALLAGFTPIVIGYGGNDGSLMGLLRDTLRPGDIPGGIYWCYWHGSPPGPAITEVVQRHGGAMIPIAGFDELMVQLNHRLGYPRMDQRIEQRARERAQRYRQSFEALHQRVLQTEIVLADDDEDEAATPPTDDSPSILRSAAAPEQAVHARDRSPDEAPAHHRSPLPASAPAPHASSVSDTRARPEAEEAPAQRTSDEPTRLATRSGATLGPVLSARFTTRGTPRPTHDEPTRSAITAALEQPTPATSAASVSFATSPADAPAPAQPAEHAATMALQQAVHALVGDDPAELDWWTLKLHADQQPTHWTRIAAYKAATVQFPRQRELLRGLACELALANQSSEAREIFHELEQTGPDDPFTHLDLAVMFVHWGAGKTQAEPRAAVAWRLALASGSDPGLLAAIAFVRGLLARREDRDDSTALRVLRHLLPVHTTALQALAAIVTRIIRNRLDEPGQHLYYRLLSCLQGKADVSTLHSVERWNALVPLAPEAAWPDDAQV